MVELPAGALVADGLGADSPSCGQSIRRKCNVRNGHSDPPPKHIKQQVQRQQQGQPRDVPPLGGALCLSGEGLPEVCHPLIALISARRSSVIEAACCRSSADLSESPITKDSPSPLAASDR